MKRAFTDRNKSMLERLLARVRSTGETPLLCNRADHIVDNGSIASLLKQRGLKVEKVLEQ